MSKENSEKTNIVFTALAKDRPGVVEAIAAVVAENSGNWVDSSMSRLAGEFAGIVMVEVDAGHADALRQALNELSNDGIGVTVQEGDTADAGNGRAAHLELTGIDHPGIVLEVTRTLAAHKVNINEMNTGVSRGSMQAEPMFNAKVDILLPDGLTIDDLREALEQIAADIMVEVSLSQV